MNKEPDKYYKCVKVSLKSIIRFNSDINTIMDSVNKGSKIVSYALQFIKLYCLNQYNKTKKLPKIDTNFIRCSLRVVCKDSGKEIKDGDLLYKFKLFYNEEFKHLNIEENLNYDGLSTLFEYLVIEIMTALKNNIKQRYFEYVKHFINAYFDKSTYRKFYIENFKCRERDIQMKILSDKLKNIYYDVLNINNNKLRSNDIYIPIIKILKQIVLPTKSNFKKDNINYDLECNPMDYLDAMFKMSSYTEMLNYPLYNLFPLSTSLIPRHIKFDSTTIVNILMTVNKAYYKTNLKEENENIWRIFFKTENKVFRKHGYKFNNSIITDGISCSILFIKDQYYNKFIPSSKFKNQNKEKYIDKLNDDEYESLKEKQIIAIDPNKEDLIYCVNGTTKNRTQFRYTQSQRNFETKKHLYKTLTEKIKKDTIIETKSIIEWETELSKLNHATLVYSKFKLYLLEKNRISKKLCDFYKKKLFKKIKLNIYLNTLNSEQKLINNLKNAYGKIENNIICIGDWEQKSQMKYMEPTKGKGFRDLFRKYGYKVYLVDEFRTSCKCSGCFCGDCEKFREKIDIRTGSKFLIHGLLKCKTCMVLWNRDENSSNNIYKISKCAINKTPRPLYLQRPKIKT